jgi:RimJ/RimL family protein N-acetyltransferase
VAVIRGVRVGRRVRVGSSNCSGVVALGGATTVVSSPGPGEVGTAAVGGEYVGGALVEPGRVGWGACVGPWVGGPAVGGGTVFVGLAVGTDEGQGTAVGGSVGGTSVGGTVILGVSLGCTTLAALAADAALYPATWPTAARIRAHGSTTPNTFRGESQTVCGLRPRLRVGSWVIDAGLMLGAGEMEVKGLPIHEIRLRQPYQTARIRAYWEGERRMLHGKNVTLRPMERSDIPRLWQFAQDIDLGLLTGADGRPTSIAALERVYEDEWSGMDPNSVRWGIEAHGTLVGGAELVDINWRNRSAKLAVWIGDHAYRRRGCGSDAMSLALNYAFRVLGLNRVSQQIIEPNAPAMSCYRKAGFAEEGRVRQAEYRDGHYHDVIVLGILRDEWTDESPLHTGEQFVPDATTARSGDA